MHGLGVAPGATLDDFVVGAVRGEGTASVVFGGVFGGKTAAAIKVDRPSPRPDMLVWESDVLLRLQPFPFFARHYTFVAQPKALVMSLLGTNLSEARRAQPGQQFPLAAVLSIAEQMLFAVEALHSIGFLHRDLKPSNFAPGLGREAGRRLFCFDLGQSRQYTLPDSHEIRPARESAEFRGTSTYSSLRAHEGRDLGRRDDMYSWLYSALDLARAGLPWRTARENRKACEALKRYYITRPEELTAGLPGSEALTAALRHIEALSFAGKPDYAFLARQLRAAQKATRAAGAEHARLRVSYADTPELREVLAGLGAVGEGGSPLRSAADLSPPPLSPSYSSDTSGGPDAALVACFDCTRLRMSVDGVLHCRGGAWGDHVYDGAGAPAGGIPLSAALSVQVSADASPEARAAMSGLLAARSVCEKIVSQADADGGGDEAALSEGAGEEAEVTEEWDDGIALERYRAALAHAAARDATRPNGAVLPGTNEPLPAWLSAIQRAVPHATSLAAAVSSLSESLADRSGAWAFRDLRSRVSRLPNDALWGAATVVLTEAGSQHAAKRARTDLSALAQQAAVAAYVLSWTALARAVLARIEARSSGALRPSTLAAAVEQLLAAARSPEQLAMPAVADGAAVESSVVAAQGALDLLRSSAVHGCFGAGTALMDVEELAPRLLSVHLTLGSVEAWARTQTGKASVPAGALMPLTLTGSSSASVDVDVDAAVLAEAKQGLAVLSSLITCLKKEAADLRPPHASAVGGALTAAPTPAAPAAAVALPAALPRLPDAPLPVLAPPAAVAGAVGARKSRFDENSARFGPSASAEVSAVDLIAAAAAAGLEEGEDMDLS